MAARSAWRNSGRSAAPVRRAAWWAASVVCTSLGGAPQNGKGLIGQAAGSTGPPTLNRLLTLVGLSVTHLGRAQVPGGAPGVALQLQRARRTHGGSPAGSRSPTRARSDRFFRSARVSTTSRASAARSAWPRLWLSKVRRKRTSRFMHADPDGIRAGRRLGGGAPVHDHIGAEQARHGRTPGRERQVGGDAAFYAPGV